MSNPDKNLECFLSAISPWEAAYVHAGLSYFAVRRDGVLNLMQGRLFLHSTPSAIPKTQFETNQVLAGYFPLSELGLEYRDLITQLVTSGRISTPVGKLVFPMQAEGQVATHFFPFHREGIRSGNRLSVLMVSGAQRDSYIQQPDIDWELKAACQPFDTLHELLNEYSLGEYRGDFANVEVGASPVIEIVFNSKVEGEEAEPSVFLAKSLDPNKCQIGFRVFLHGKVVSRGSVNGKEIIWTEQDHSFLGISKIVIPRGAVLHCVASYDGFAHHQGWIADPKNSQNSRRATLEEFDDKLEVLRDYLFEEQKLRKDSRHFEFGVAWLMWMLGFSVAQVGGTARTADAADIVATTPSGNVLVVECTTGLLKAENKLAKLVDRAEVIRKRLDSSGNSHLKILPVIVTAKSRDEIRADLEQALKLGVVVVTKETLIERLSQTIVVTDADRIFEQALESIRPRQESLGLMPDGVS